MFSVSYAALQALSMCHPLLKVRALAEGSKKAKGKAIRRAGRTFIKHIKLFKLLNTGDIVNDQKKMRKIQLYFVNILEPLCGM